MKTTTIAYALLSMLAGVMLISCASDKAESTTVTQPTATQTTTQTTRY